MFSSNGKEILWARMFFEMGQKKHEALFLKGIAPNGQALAQRNFYK